jgi:hypothetical protein
MQKIAKCFRIFIKEALNGGEAFLGLAFHHVAGQSPGSRRETQNRNFRADGLYDSPDSFEEKASFQVGIEKL